MGLRRKLPLALAEPAAGPNEGEPPRVFRSSEELEMRDAVVAWGRRRWPQARVMHELAVGGRRIDLAFVLPEHLVGIEIKSSKDVLDRLDLQVETYQLAMPEVWVAFAPRWLEKVGHAMTYNLGETGVSWRVGRLMVDGGQVVEALPTANGMSFKCFARPDSMMTAPMLHLMHKPEMTDLAVSHGLTVKTKDSREKIAVKLARGLTGDQIIAGVCAALRRRRTGWKADDPIS